jgi:hypothetical protein
MRSLNWTAWLALGLLILGQGGAPLRTTTASHPSKDRLQFLGFWEYGSATNHAPLPGEPSEIALSSVGLGVRYTINTYLSVRYDYGFQLHRTGCDNDHGSRSDLGVVELLSKDCGNPIRRGRSLCLNILNCRAAP